MGELSDGASENNCKIYDLRLQIGVHAFLAGRYRALKSEICILKPGTRPKGGSPQDKSKISELLSFFSMFAS